MKIVATRDDGARLIAIDDTFESPAVIALPEGGYSIVSRGAALARGTWSDSDESVSADTAETIKEILRNEDDSPLTAALNSGHTGAMIALIPTWKDAQRLAVDFGEESEELHVTLAYLGEAAMIPVDVQHKLVECVAECVARFPTIVADAFAVAMFNPDPTIAITAGDRKPCVVLEISGSQITTFKNIVMQDVEALFAQSKIPLHEQHQPWRPHITLVYTNEADLTYFTGLTGPVTFDHVRLAFAGEVYDIPLGDTGLVSDVHSYDYADEYADEVDDGYDDVDDSVIDIIASWDEAAHPRAPAGSPAGGQFAPPDDSQAEKKTEKKKKKENQFDGPDMSYDPSKNRGTGYGKRGGDRRVRTLQRALNRLGLTDANGKKLAVDGKLGPLTTQAIKTAQKMLGVKADGIVTPKLLEQLAKTKQTGKSMSSEVDLEQERELSNDDITAAVSWWDEQDWYGELTVPNVLLDYRAFQRERDVNIPSGPGHNLRNYWVRGPGAAKIGWGTDGSFARCVANLSKYVKRPQGLCAEYHKAATGEWPAEKGVPSEGAVEVFAPEVLYDGDVAQSSLSDDCPSGHHYGENGECMPDDIAVVKSSPKWRGVLTVEGIESGDSRMFAANALTWDDPPLPLMWQKETSHGGRSDVSVRVGSIEKIWREADPSGRSDVYRIMGEGTIDDESEDGREVHRRMRRGYMRGNSVDVDSVKNADVQLVFPAVDDVTDAADLTELFAEPDVTVYSRGRIRATTLVEIPAFTEARLALVDTDDVTAGAAGTIALTAVPRHDTATTNDPWDAGKNVERLPSPLKMSTAHDVFAWIDSADAGDGEITKSAAKLPHHMVNEDGIPGAANIAACSSAIGALHGARGGVDIPDADRRAVYEHLAQHIRDAGGEPPAFSVAENRLEDIVAATTTINIVDAPPREWFNEPNDVTPTGALTVTPEGRVYGYIAPAKTRHRSFTDRAQYVPMKNVDYTRFMGGETIVADGGRVSTGNITMNCGHASTAIPLSADSASEHYDNTCSVVATVRVGENKNGVWMAGALLPDITPAQLRRIMACRLSGDWRKHLDRSGWREFVAALLVPVPGFPMARINPTATLSEGQLVASSVPVSFITDSSDDHDSDNDDNDDNSANDGKNDRDDNEVPTRESRDRVAATVQRIAALRGTTKTPRDVNRERVNALRARINRGG